MHSDETDRFWILMGKKKSGEASAEELVELESLLASRDLSGYSLEILDRVWEIPFEEIPNNSPSDKPWNRILSVINPPVETPVRRFPRFQKWVAAASIISIAAFAALYILHGSRQESANRIAVNKTSEFSTPAVSKSKLILPDGTQVWLNGNSQLSYDVGGFGSLGREVHLTGEAFFDVVKNENLPFIIHTKLVDIRVKGTAFNVKAYPGEKTMETALVRGLIEVTTKQDPDRRILLKPNEKIVVSLESIQENLKKGDSQQSKTDAVYAITTLRKNQSDKIAETVWMQTRLVFDNESFRDLGPKLQEWFNIKIKLADENIGNKRFSGVIEKETLTETLQAMQLSFPFTYQFKQGELEISSK